MSPCADDIDTLYWYVDAVPSRWRERGAELFEALEMDGDSSFTNATPFVDASDRSPDLSIAGFLKYFLLLPFLSSEWTTISRLLTSIANFVMIRLLG